MAEEESRRVTLVTGARGMVGQALVKRLESEGWQALLLPGRAELDLLNREQVRQYLRKNRPSYVFHLAARVGGIRANISAPYAFLAENLLGTVNLIDASLEFDVERFMFLGSSCVYPRNAAQPMKEESLLTGPLEPTNEGYALAKIAGLRLIQYAEREGRMRGVCAMPCNIYGTNDHFEFERSHVLSALVRRFVEATDAEAPFVEMWGTGAARREFIHVNDVARALVHLWKNVDSAEMVNVGTGYDVTIRDLAMMIAREVGYLGEIRWDVSQPDGMPRKCVDTSRLTALGFSPQISLEDGITQTVSEFRNLKKRGMIK